MGRVESKLSPNPPRPVGPRWDDPRATLTTGQIYLKSAGQSEQPYIGLRITPDWIHKVVHILAKLLSAISQVQRSHVWLASSRAWLGMVTRFFIMGPCWAKRSPVPCPNALSDAVPWIQMGNRSPLTNFRHSSFSITPDLSLRFFSLCWDLGTNYLNAVLPLCILVFFLFLRFRNVFFLPGIYAVKTICKPGAYRLLDTSIVVQVSFVLSPSPSPCPSVVCRFPLWQSPSYCSLFVTSRLLLSLLCRLSRRLIVL